VTPDPERETKSAAERLLEREAPPGYLAAWARALSAAPAAARAADRVAAVFRLGDERFALDASVVREVHVPRAVHRVPGRTNEIFRGIVALRGELHLCADLHGLLGCARAPEGTRTPARMVVIGRPGEAWAFEADEVKDVQRFDPSGVAPAQVTIAKAAVRFTDGVVTLPDGPAAILDPERLFAGLSRSLS
jgi:chemotaxis-related protein WspD